MATIYVLADPRISDPVARIRYVGKTARSLRVRFQCHIKTAKRVRRTRFASRREIASVGG